MTFDFPALEKRAPSFFPEFFCRLGFYLEYREFKYLVKGLMTSEQFRSSMLVYESTSYWEKIKNAVISPKTTTFTARRYFVLRCVAVQLKVNQSEGSSSNDMHVRVLKLSRFLKGAIVEFDTFVAKVLIDHSIFKSLSTLQCENALEISYDYGTRDVFDYLKHRLFFSVDSNFSHLGIGFAFACRNGQHDLFLRLKDQVSKEDIQSGFLTLCDRNNPVLLVKLLSSEHLNEEILRKAAKKASLCYQIAVLDLLIEHPLLDPDTRGRIFKYFCYWGNTVFVTKMMDDPRITAEAFVEAFDSAAPEILPLLEDDDRLEELIELEEGPLKG
jgi:hypothetical protein